MAERRDEYVGVWVFGSGGKIFRNDCIVIEIGRRVEWFVNRFLFLHVSSSYFALRISETTSPMGSQSPKFRMSRWQKAGQGFWPSLFGRTQGTATNQNRTTEPIYSGVFCNPFDIPPP